MSTTNTTGFKTFPAAAALSAFRRVVLNSAGRVALAGASEKGIGVTRADASALGDLVLVQLFTAPGSTEIAVDTVATFTIGNTAYSAANGTIRGTVTTGAVAIGTINGTAAGSLDVIEIIPA